MKIDETKSIDQRSDILSLPSNTTEDLISFSDIPISAANECLSNKECLLKNNNISGNVVDNDNSANVMKIESQSDVTNILNLSSETNNQFLSDDMFKQVSSIGEQINLAAQFRKPKGSAYIRVKIRLDDSNQSVEAYVCVDTGADITLCDSTYLITHFGSDALKYVIPMSDPPKLRSATGHNLEILGRVPLTLYLGEYKLETQVITYKGTSSIFLLGNDSFYGRLIYDRGLFLGFAEGNFPPIPIHYELDRDKVRAMKQYNVAPRSHALIQVKVTDSPQLTGKEVLLTPLISDDSNLSCHRCEFDRSNFAFDNLIPVRNSVSVIDSIGNAFLLVQNNTDDILTIQPNVDIAAVSFISDNGYESEQVSLVIDPDSELSGKRDSQWPISALQGELGERLPSNVIVQWDKLCDDGQGHKQVNISSGTVNFIHDKEERKQLLDGTGEGFPTPPSAQTEPPPIDLDSDPEAWLMNVDHAHLSESEWTRLRAVLVRNSDAFSKSKTDIGCCRYFKVDLPLKPGTGYLYNKPRPMPFKHKEIAAEQISELLAKGVIRISQSPHATNVVIVKKKTIAGVVSHRMCVDLRQVNEHSIPNRFPNRSVEETMGKVQGAIFCTSKDFKDAFHMMMLTDSSIPVTAFYFDNVLYEYVRLPFGHVCAMNAFCCLMALLCVDYEPASYYADDLLITTKLDHNFTRDQQYDQHLDHIEGMLKRIIDAGLKLVAHKTQWCYSADKPMDWLGFTMQNNLLKPQESKVAAIKNFPVPSTAKQVISFISTASFYRRFIKSFAKEVQPMYTVANTEPFVWTTEAHKAFDRVKEIMCSDLVIRLPRQGEPFQLYSDASAGAIGVVLCQIDPVDKKSHPCAYGSRKFNDCEMKLSIPCKELLAIVYGLNLWSFYICGNPVQVFSDCRAWTFLKVQCGASGKISRLALLVSEYDITISYVKGTANKAADGLSRAWDDGLTKFDDQITARHPALNELGAPVIDSGVALKLEDYLEKCDEYVSSHWPKILKEYEERLPAKGSVASSKYPKSNKSVKQRLDNYEKDVLTEGQYVNSVIEEAAILHVDRQSSNFRFRNYDKDGIYPFLLVDDSIAEEPGSNTGTDSSDAESVSEDEETDTTNSSIRTASFNIRLIAINESCFSLEAFADLQKQDEFCSGKIGLLQKKDQRTKSSGYFIKRKILMREMSTKDSQTYNVICVPEVLIKPLLESTHRSLLSGHFGSKRYLVDMSRRYYWPKMRDDIIDYQHRCLPCQYNDKFPVKYLSGHVIRPLWPMHVVHCDLVVGLPKALDGSYAILLLYDGFSRFTFGIPLGSEKADYVVNKLMSHFVAAFGLPWALHSDNGRNIDGAYIRHLSRLLGVIKTSTPPHTPNANPTETMCGAVSMLLRKALNESDQRYWSLGLPFILNALNSTVHTATGYTPNSLFFGRFQERDPIPLIPFEAESANVNEYFQKMRRFQELAFQIVRSRNERKLTAKKVQWDTTAKTHPYKEGDFVLVKNNNPASGPGKMKLRSKYVGPFRVLKAYTSSLIVVPWTENTRLEEYSKSPDLFRLIHRGDIKPFHTRQVSVKHCKPYHGKIETQHIVDPIMLTRFLDSLGLDSSDEILSEIDSTPWSGDTIDTWSTLSDSSDPGSIPTNSPKSHFRDRERPSKGTTPKSDSSDSGPDSDNGDDPVEQPPIIEDDQQPADNRDLEDDLDNRQPDDEFPDINPEFDNRPNAEELLLENLDISQATKDAMKKYYKHRNVLEDISRNANIYKKHIGKLEQLLRDPDPEVRNRAEFELANTLDRMKLDLKRAEREAEATELSGDSSGSDSDSDSDDTSSASSVITVLSDSKQSNPDDELFDMPDLEWDEEKTDLEGPNPADQNIHIKTPNVEVTISPTKASTSSVSPPKTLHSKTYRKSKDIEKWMSVATPEKAPIPDTQRTVITRSGRITQRPAKFKDFVGHQKSKASSKAESTARYRVKQGRSEGPRSDPAPSTSKRSVRAKSSSREDKSSKTKSSKEATKSD